MNQSKYQILLEKWNVLKDKVLKQKQSLINQQEILKGQETALQFLRTRTAQQEQELELVKQELTKEQGWWAKWMTDENLQYRGKKFPADISLPNFVYKKVGLKGESQLLIGFDYYPFVDERLDFHYKSLNNNPYNPKFVEMTQDKLRLFKQIIQAISDYYKEQIN